MRPSFLCHKHRDWLFEDLHRAENYWSVWTRASKLSTELNRERESIVQQGCAWELTEHLLHNNWPETAVATDLFSIASLELCRLLLAHGMNNQAEKLMVYARAKLNTRVINNPADTCALSCLAAVDQACNGCYRSTPGWNAEVPMH